MAGELVRRQLHVEVGQPVDFERLEHDLLSLYRQLARLVISSAKVKAYASLSLEAGNVFQPDDPTALDALRPCGSVFVGLDTSLGPVYLAWGYADGGQKRLVFRFGQSF